MPPKSKMPSKADLSANWRLQSNPRAAAASTTASSARCKPPANVFRAFAKKPRLVNPYSAQPHLWSDFTEYRVGLKCELCKTNVLVFPQVLNVCKHIFCAKCINDHYIVADKEQCPTCAAYICPSDNPSYDDDDGRYHFRLDVGYEEYCGEEEEEAFRCVCVVQDCPGDCGTLSCGCIDTCRGRCDHRYEDRYEHLF